MLGKLAPRERQVVDLLYQRGELAVADGDRDGQVTPTEYARAKEYIAARW